MYNNLIVKEMNNLFNENKYCQIRSLHFKDIILLFFNYKKYIKVAKNTTN